MIVGLTEKYNKEVVPEMQKLFGYKSSMAAPRIRKVVINSGFGRQIGGKTTDEGKKIAEAILNDLGLISGQKAQLTMARQSIASFKIREGQAIGAKVTLRKKKMNDFLEKLIHVVLPRTKDFRGISSKAFDKKGNLTLGVKEHIVFPEILPERAKSIFGLEITVVADAGSKKEGMELLRLLGFPIEKVDIK
jgi:large subunit ribosomal protein L5